MKLINSRVIDLVKTKIPDESKQEEDGTKTPPTFFLLAYDVASENTDQKDKERTEKLRLRQNLFYRIMCKHLKLQNSVYIVNSKKLMNTIERIEELYKEHPDWIELSIAGEMYKESLEPLLTDYIETETKNLKELLEHSEVDIKKATRGEDTQKIKQKLYGLSSSIGILRERVGDLQELTGIPNQLYEQNCSNLENYHQQLLSKIRYA